MAKLVFRFLFVVAVGLIYLFLPKNVFAATLYWVGANGANASVAANWSTTNPTSCSTGVTPSGSAPGSADTMNFDADCDNGATIDSSFTSPVGNVAISSGYSGTVSQSNPLTISGTFTQDAGVYTGTASLTIGSSVTLNGGTLTLPDGADLNGTSATDALKITGGIFNAPSGTMTLARGLNITGTPTFNANNGTFIFDGGTATLNCNNVSFHLVQIAHANNAKTINSNCNLPLGDNPTIGTQIVGVSSGQVILSGTLSGTGTLTTVSGGSPFTLNAGAVLDGFTGLTVKSMTVSGATLNLSSFSSFYSASGTVTLSSGSLTLPSGANFDGNISISGGTFTAPNGTMTLAGNFSVSGSPTINHNNGTITLDGTNQTISGSTVFYNLVKTTSSSATLTFTAGTTQTIQGTLVLKGESGAVLSLASSVTNSVWSINPTGSRTLANLSVRDSVNINSLAMTGVNLLDAGNNTGWIFNGILPIYFSLDYPVEDSHVTSARPGFKWKKAVDNSNSTIYKYQLWVDNGETGDFNIDNIVTSALDANNKPSTKEFDKYTIIDDGDYLTLITKGSSYWPSDQNDGELTLGKKTWRIIAFDNAGNTQEESKDFWVYDAENQSGQYKPKLTKTQGWFPLQINRISGVNTGIISSFRAFLTDTYTLSSNTIKIQGVAFAYSNISILVTDLVTKKATLYTTVGKPDSSWSMTITLPQQASLDAWVTLGDNYNFLPTIYFR